MERAQHLEWCKERANEYLNNGDLKNAFASFQIDMGKHPETAHHAALGLGTMLLVSGNLSNVNQMKEWIDGFN